jgi:RNA polymerase-binding transcription factor DksA
VRKAFFYFVSKCSDCSLLTVLRQWPQWSKGLPLHHEQQQEVIEISSEEEENKTETSLSSNETREVSKMWETVQKIVEKHHPSKAVAVITMNLFNDNAMSYFREILKRGQKQLSLDKFLVKDTQKEKESTDSSSDSVSDNESRPTQSIYIKM